MNELSLFTGAGGGVLGTHHFLGWKSCGYVEWNEYCQRVIAARIADGHLTSAPIFGDVREFVQSGAAGQYRGVADVVTAGFPCQPFSVAGKQAGADDERNMWPATRDVIRIVQPQSVLLENVPGLVSCGYIGTVIADLAALGYVGKWGVIGAADAGAPHRRDRLWIVAHAPRELPHRHRAVPEQTGSAEHSDGGKAVAHANGNRLQGCANGRGIGLAPINEPGSPTLRGSSPWGVDPANDPESGVGRVADGVAHRVDRLKATGNGQVSVVAARAWRELAA
jgi:DNA (cytosine-5)-methyltransferase 1